MLAPVRPSVTSQVSSDGATVLSCGAAGVMLPTSLHDRQPGAEKLL